MWLAFAVLAVGAVPAQDGAEALFKRMEQAILKADTVDLKFETTIEQPGSNPPRSMKGRLLIAPGNKSRVEMEVKAREQTTAVALVSDGTKRRTTRAGA